MLKHLPLAIVLCLLAHPGCAQADAIVATVASWHATNHGGSTGYNEANSGLGYEHPLNESHTLALGFYDNSYGRNTDYLLDLWQPLQGRTDFGTFKFGLAIGIASGYEDDSFTPVAVPMLTYENSTWGLNLVTVTFPTPVLVERSVFALQLKIRLP
ncbi:MAG TPA: hypothetical protein VFR06_06410 [Gallionellaceae bacterium]|nr:hypothetical protein [Gallionellaceae bacterium]